MPLATYDFSPKTLGSVLKGDRLLVPPNQRPYSWEDRHVLSLLQDFDQAIDRDDYFLGTVVLIKGAGDRLMIQDGQQRLATTTILLARIRDLLVTVRRDGSARSVDTDFIRSIDRDTEETVAKLVLSTTDNDYFSRAIISGPKDWERDGRPAPIRQSHHRLQEASKTIDDFLKKKLDLLQPENKAATLLSWVRFIEQNSQVVVVSAKDAIDAYRIFETLNDRGVKASQADILKNYLFSRADDRLSEAEDMWNQIVSTIETLGSDDSDDSLITYLRHYWITGHGPTKEKDLASKMREELTGKAKALQFLADCNRAAQLYVALSNPQHPRWASYKRSVRQHVETIYQHLQVEQIKPLLFAVVMKFDPIEAEKAFKLFVSWSVRFLVVGGRGGMLDTQYSLRAQDVGTGAITKARELRDAMKSYVPTDTEFQEAFSVARISRPHIARYYLRAIEKTLTADPEPEFVANEDMHDINLEHVMPLTPSAAWPIDSETSLAAQKLLGNMVLLRATENRDIANKSYTIKKAALANSAYLTTKLAAAAQDWDLASIRARQSELAAVAVSTWSLKFGGE